jgi:hypothetical protein
MFSSSLFLKLFNDLLVFPDTGSIYGRFLFSRAPILPVRTGDYRNVLSPLCRLFLCFAIFFKKLNEHFSSFVHHELPLASRFFSQDGSLFSRSKEIPVGCPTPPGNDLASRRGGKKFAKGTSKAETLEHHRTIPLKAGNYSVLYGNRTATLA